MVNKHKPPRIDTSKIRIIGGNLRSRTITFPSIPGLRPTPNRVRETLFNWLAPYINQAVCLDMFAGSGALAFEAMSRDAAYCLLLDSDPVAISALLINRDILGITQIDVVHASFPFSQDVVKDKKFSIIFLDPPFHEGYVQRAIEWLLHTNCLQHNALIYVESESNSDVLSLPSSWSVLKDKIAGEVRYSLVQTG